MPESSTLFSSGGKQVIDQCNKKGLYKNTPILAIKDENLRDCYNL